VQLLLHELVYYTFIIYVQYSIILARTKVHTVVIYLLERERIETRARDRPGERGM